MKNAKALFTLNVVLLIVSWAMAAYFYPSLPDRIPTHFGPSGQADAWSHKSFWSVFLLPIFQTGLIVIFSLLYRYPQYSNIPSTIALEALEPEFRDHIFEMIRRLLAVIFTFINAIFLYILWVMLRAGMSPRHEINPAIFLGWMGALLIFIAVYMIRMIRKTRAIVREAKARRGEISIS